MGRRVVIAGGTKGIGLVAAERFAAAGDTVLALGRDRGALAALPAGIKGGECDVTDEAAVAAAFAATGPVDVLVINAGAAETAPLAQTTLASWQGQIAVNATAAFLCTRAVIEPMRERGSGAIVTVASTAGRVGSRYTCAYTASKHAALGVMRSAAAELAGSGANANAVCPTFVDTEMTRRSVERIVERTGRSAEQASADLAATSPLGRLLAPGEVAAAIFWLASAEARATNGQSLVIDGGGVQS